MATQQQVIKALGDLMGLKQGVQADRYALTGDGSGAATSDVDGRPGWTWVRYDDNQSRVAQVFNHRYPGIPADVPVVIGKERANDTYMQILSINWPIYFDKITSTVLSQYVTPPHGPTHNAATGGDPAYMELDNLKPGRVRPQVPASLSVFSESLWYDNAGVMTRWGGGAIDLSAYVPGAADTHRYVLVTLSPGTNSLAAYAGTAVPSGDPAAPPDIPLGQIPLAVVLLSDATTEITKPDIYDYRLLFSAMGGPSATAMINEIALLAESVFLLLTNHVVEGR